MRGEHADMRNTLAQLRAAVQDRDADEFAGEAETLLIMMQQHNMKEESVIYPMLDSRLPGDEQERLSASVGKHLVEARAA